MMTRKVLPGFRRLLKTGSMPVTVRLPSTSAVRNSGTCTGRLVDHEQPPQGGTVMTVRAQACLTRHRPEEQQSPLCAVQRQKAPTGSPSAGGSTCPCTQPTRHSHGVSLSRAAGGAVHALKQA